MHKHAPELAVYQYHGLKLVVPRGVFNPVYTISTGLLLEVVDKLPPFGVAVDLGTGSGVVALYTAMRGVAEVVVAYDVDPLALATARVNARLNGLEGRVKVVGPDTACLSGLLGSVDLVLANPPYLPLDPREPVDRSWCAGSRLEVLEVFVCTARRLLRARGVLLLVVSSLTGLEDVLHVLECYGFASRIAAHKLLAFEKIYVIYAVAGGARASG